MPQPIPVSPPRVDWITLAVGDLDRSRSFYESLGFGPGEAHGKDLLVFKLEGGGRLALIEANRYLKEVGIEGGGGQPGGVLLSRNLTSAEDVHEMLQRLIKAGGTSTREAGTTEWGTVSGWILDPDGHPWEICFNPHIHHSSQEEPTT